MRTACILVTVFFISCNAANNDNAATSTSKQIVGTWQLLNGTLIEKGDTIITDYTKNVSFVKIINDTHFAFLQHDLSKGKDSASAVFVAGGGNYTINDSSYTEHLQYCSDRQWEGNDFPFTVHINSDTLTIYGVEKVASAGVNRINIEKYVRLKK